MRVYFDEAFYRVYAADPAADAGRMEAIVAALEPEAVFETITPATETDLLRTHIREHIDRVHDMGVYDIAALAAGGAIQAASCGLAEPASALIRPPGHHASADSCWGFCYFNNFYFQLVSLFAKPRNAEYPQQDKYKRENIGNDIEP